MWQRVLLVLSAVLMSAASPSLSSQARAPASPAETAGYEAELIRSVSRFREQVAGWLPLSERRTEDTIRYRVLRTGALNAQASKSKEGQRDILLSAGHMALLAQLSEWAIAPRWGAPEECVMTYLREMIDTVEENGRRAAVGKDLEYWDNFPDFAFERRSLCAEFSPRRYEGDPYRIENVRSISGRSFTFVAAHELAHHIKGHLDHKSPMLRKTKTEQLEQSRDNEREADRFALTFITRDGPENAIYALPAFLLTAILSCGADEEKDSTHPSAAWRWRIMVDALAEGSSRDSDWTRYLEQSRQGQTFKELLAQMSTAFY
jgi:hypothetical protein